MLYVPTLGEAVRWERLWMSGVSCDAGGADHPGGISTISRRGIGRTLPTCVLARSLGSAAQAHQTMAVFLNDLPLS